MPSKGHKSGSHGSEAYELLTRETSLEQLNGSSNSHPLESHHEERTSIYRRSRRSHSHESPREQVLALLTQSPLDLRKAPRQPGGSLAVALELIIQSTPSLLCAVIGSVMTGLVFDQVQFRPAFERIEELFVLVPILLNLKGCLEMNLASRLSTSVITLICFADFKANIGELDIRRTRRAIVIGNLALLQVQVSPFVSIC
jgi:hypothetical protein